MEKEKILLKLADILAADGMLTPDEKRRLVELIREEYGK
jgi:hypothetical protein